MSEPEVDPPPRVAQLRVVLRVEEFEEALAFYRDRLGLAQEVRYPGEDDDGEVALLEAGRATLELVNTAQAKAIDRLEAGDDPPAPARVRLAFEVDDAARATTRLAAGGAAVVAGPRPTPWGSLNARLDGPGGVQLTLFEQLQPE